MALLVFVVAVVATCGSDATEASAAKARCIPVLRFDLEPPGQLLSSRLHHLVEHAHPLLGDADAFEVDEERFQIGKGYGKFTCRLLCCGYDL